MLVLFLVFFGEGVDIALLAERGSGARDAVASGDDGFQAVNFVEECGVFFFEGLHAGEVLSNHLAFHGLDAVFGVLSGGEGFVALGLDAL
ncbi:hypothetical protein HBH56_098780 [Parastagonospora nodorum]|nr:hypothetical protein HBH56_098780 [Parastagonospora nodorum]KAH3930427.1 hypothetical protein HBH54_113100 [Parastagonospora nodorum]KAH3981121.1 hypothetical protein HBH52_086650 [Parastagonospora nodorum]KAH4022713.1 hypothetical protein HBI09_166660 [Parastagonospora nodorum]KAH4028189.1 hypothetical protein HBI13_051710 [Parastagonospora nodorum]